MSISISKVSKHPGQEGDVYYIYVDGIRSTEVILDITEDDLKTYTHLLEHAFSQGQTSRTKEISRLLGVK